MTLKELRMKKNMTQRQVAEAVGMPQPQYCRIETGRQNWTRDTMLAIGHVLDFDLLMVPRRPQE